MSQTETSSNVFLDYRREPTWDDPDCKVEIPFSTYVEEAFPGRVWTFCSRYLSGSDEEQRLVTSLKGALMGVPVRESTGALFDDDNKTRGAIIVRSQMGTGKTSTLKSIMKSIDEMEKEMGRKMRIVCISSRVSFGYTLMEVLTQYGFQMYNMLVEDVRIHDVDRLIISMESMHKLQNPYHNKEMLYPDLFIWDEYTSGAIHVKSPTILEKGVLLDYVRETAKSGATQFLYMDAFYDTDGVDIIRSMHPRTNIGVLWNAKRPARPGMIKFHYLEDIYDNEILQKIEACKVEWSDEIVASVQEGRDPIFDKQMVFCFMSKRSLDNKIKHLASLYPSLFLPQYICRIHSDCDADAARTTLSATTHWPRFIGIFYTSSVLVGTNFNAADRPDILRAMKAANDDDLADSVRKEMLKKVRVDIFCNGMSKHPCAISLAQMMARTRYAGDNGVVHFLIPPNNQDDERFPVDKASLIEYLDSTRCYMSDPQISRDSGCVKATTIYNPETGRRYVAHALKHNSLFVKFYVYAKLCANRSKMSFFAHLKSILDGFSETVFNSTCERLAPLIFLADDSIKKKLEKQNMLTRSKRTRETMDEDSYTAAFAKIVEQLKDDQLSFTSDVLRPFDMSDEKIRQRRHMNDELVYDILRFLLSFKINDLPSRRDNENMCTLRSLVFEIHPWYKNYHAVYEMMSIPADKNCKKLLDGVINGKITDVGASTSKFRSLLLLLSFKRIFPQFVAETPEGSVLSVSTTANDHLDLTYTTARHLEFSENPLIHCSMTTPAIYDIIFGDITNAPTKVAKSQTAHAQRIHLVKHLNFILDVAGFDPFLQQACGKMSNREANMLGIPRSQGRVADGRVSTSTYAMRGRAHDIACLYLFRDVSDRLGVTRCFDRASNIIFKQQVAHTRGFKYTGLFTMTVPEEVEPSLPSIEALGFIGDIRPVPSMPAPGCTSYFISRNPEHPMQSVIMPFEETYSGVEEHDTINSITDSPSISSNGRKRPFGLDSADSPGPLVRYFRSMQD